MEQKTNDPFETLTDVQSVIVCVGVVLFVVTFILTCIKGFPFLFFKGAVLFLISIMLIGIPLAIYAIKKEMAIPPEIRAAIRARRFSGYEETPEEEEKRRRERERAERRADTFSILAWYHILFGRKK